MLHERQPSVLGLLDVIGLALVEVRRMHLLELALVAVHREAGKALRAEGFRHGIAIALRLAVMGQLEVRVGGKRRAAAVAQLQAHVDHVAVAREGKRLLDLESVPGLRGEPQLDALGARRQRARSRLGAP